jgi:predicted Zn-dependent protease
MMMHIRSKFKTNITALVLCGLIAFTPTAIAQQTPPPLIRDTEIEAIFKEWAAPLLKSSGIPHVDIILVQSNQINAFVAGGANIFFYTGLLQKTDGPGEVLGVMAHEMGHIAGGHLIAQRSAMERASYESILGMVLGLGAAAVTGNGQAANAIILGGNSLAQRRYLSHSRIHESSADQAGFTFLTSASINPSGMSTFLGKLDSEELLPASQQSEYMRTHPVTRSRIEAVNALITKTDLRDKAFPPLWIEQHARMKAKLTGFINPAQVEWAYEDQDQSIAARYARAIAAYRLNDIQGALKQIDALIAAEPKNPYFQELKGQVLLESGRVRDAVPYYQKSVALLPEASLLRIALAHALIESGDEPANLKEAITHLKRAEKTEDRSTRIHRLLATAYGRLGQERAAKLELAEEALLQRRFDYAKSQAEGAISGLAEGSPEWVKGKDILLQIETLSRDKDL